MTTTEDRVRQPVDDPTDLTREDYKAAVVSALKETKNDDVPTLASAAAFRLFLSLFPTLVAVVGVWSLVTDPAELSAAAERLRGILPGSAAEFVSVRLEDLAQDKEGSLTALVIGFAGGLWAATGAAAGLMKALSTAYDVEETRKLPKLRLQALVLCFALLVALLSIFVLLIVGPQVEDALLGPAVPVVDAAVTVARYALALLVLVVLFAFTYWMGPNREQPSWEWISPGAVVATIGWLGASLAFSWYAQSLGEGRFEAYGTLAGPIVLMLWLQLTMLIVLVGAEINAEILRRRGIHQAVQGGIGFGAPAPAAGVFVGDAETGAAGIAEAHTDLAGTDEDSDGSDRAAEVPLVSGRSPAPTPRREPHRVVDLERDDPDDLEGSGHGRRNAGILAGIIGGGLALIFARKRRR